MAGRVLGAGAGSAASAVGEPLERPLMVFGWDPRLDFRDPHIMRLRQVLPVPCQGVDHLDFTADGHIAIASADPATRDMRRAFNLQHARRWHLPGFLRRRGGPSRLPRASI
jgi:hypothetical protein